MSRATSTYNVHAYHTKVPPEAIRPFIERHTARGGLCLDPFSGSGMTGVAAALAGRRAILNDLSPAAVHIASNYTTPCDPDALAAAAQRLLAWAEPQIDPLYLTRCPSCGEAARAEYVVWSDERACPHCQARLVVWDSRDAGSLRHLTCRSCGETFEKVKALVVGEKPVLVNLSLCFRLRFPEGIGKVINFVYCNSTLLFYTLRSRSPIRKTRVEMFSRSFARVNTVLMLHSEVPLSTGEIARSAGLSYELTASALRTMENRRLVTRSSRLGKDVFAPNRSDPHYPMAYGSALVDLPLAEALAGERIYAVYAYGSLARAGGGTSRSDLDLLIVGDIKHREELVERLALLGARYGRAVDPFVLDAVRFEQAKAKGDPHVEAALAGVRISGEA